MNWPMPWISSAGAGLGCYQEEASGAAVQNVRLWTPMTHRMNAAR